jgi:dCTP diphosphatase
VRRAGGTLQWLTEEQSYLKDEPGKREEVAMELADILIFLIRCSERLDIDLVDAAYRKIEINEARYPTERVRGDARRASEYD